MEKFASLMSPTSNSSLPLQTYPVAQKIGQFYWAKAFTRGFEKKSKFKDLKENICINILGRNIFKDDVICREYVLYDIENKNRLDECLSIYFVELQKGQFIEGQSVKDLWIKLLSDSKKAKELPKEKSIIKKAVEKVEQISEVDDIQFKVIEEALQESKRLDWQDDVLEEAENMIKEAEYKAKEAEHKAKIQMAKNLLSMGLLVEQIKVATGLDIDIIKNLIK